ncbi:hypothetical protein CEXT_380811 [Caerostris extrusa]|uniref:Uncharacterized protein n=1 Tax=Caerostris extrusa TaxID=172846 RepID=A0AAV4YDH3_CAEEX|nr:hypothetical protein CEXT_380811 [Caerostris extrusa]
MPLSGKIVVLPIENLYLQTGNCSSMETKQKEKPSRKIQNKELQQQKCLSAGKSSLFLLKTYTSNTGNCSSMETKQKRIALNSELILDMVTFNTIYDEQIKQYEKSADISILKFKNNRQNALVNLSFNPLFHSKLNPSLVFKKPFHQIKRKNFSNKMPLTGKIVALPIENLYLQHGQLQQYDNKTKESADIVNFNTMCNEQIEQYEKAAEISIFKFNNNHQTSPAKVPFNTPLFHSQPHPSLFLKTIPPNQKKELQQQKASQRENRRSSY